MVVPATVRVFPEKSPDREACFGETHVHTSWSFDVVGRSGHAPPDIGPRAERPVAARSNEFGYVNYEIVPAPNQLGDN